MNSSPFERALPSNIEAERAILGAVLLVPQLIREAQIELTADDFFLDSHKRVYRAMVQLNADSRDINPISLQDVLRNAGALDLIGGPAFVACLTDGVARFTNISEYIRIVKGKRLCRRIIQASDLTMKRAFEQEDEPEKILLQLANWCSKALAGLRDEGLESHGELVESALRQIQAVRANPAIGQGITTGFVSLDNAVNGFERGSKYVIAGYSSLGKTTLAKQMSEAAAFSSTEERRVVPLYVSLEMTGRQLVEKDIARLSGVGVRSMRRGILTAEEYGNVLDAGMRSAGMELYYVSKLRALKDGLRTRIEQLQLKTENKAELVVFIDTLQLFASVTSGPESNDVAEAANDLKQIAIDYNLPIVELSQITTDGKYKIEDEPNESMLRGSRDIFMAADVLWFIHAPEGLESTRRQLIQRKDRFGPRIKYYEFDFQGARNQFVEMPG